MYVLCLVHHRERPNHEVAREFLPSFPSKHQPDEYIEYEIKVFPTYQKIRGIRVYIYIYIYICLGYLLTFGCKVLEYSLHGW